MPLQRNVSNGLRTERHRADQGDDGDHRGETAAAAARGVVAAGSREGEPGPASRLIANSSRDAPTTHARQQPNALTAAPRVTVSPTQARDVGRADVAHQGAGVDERVHPLVGRRERHHLDRRDEGEVDAAEDRRAEDGARDVAARVPGLLAEGRRGLEPREGQQAEDDAEEQRRHVGAGLHVEDVEA